MSLLLAVLRWIEEPSRSCLEFLHELILLLRLFVIKSRSSSEWCSYDNLQITRRPVASKWLQLVDAICVVHVPLNLSLERRPRCSSAWMFISCQATNILIPEWVSEWVRWRDVLVRVWEVSKSSEEENIEESQDSRQCCELVTNCHYWESGTKKEYQQHQDYF